MENDRPMGFKINETARLFNCKVRDMAAKNGISTTYLVIIGCIKHHDKLTQKEICEHIKMKAPTVSLTLQNMENEGLIERIKDTADSRKQYVELTEKGNELAKEVKSFFDETDKLIESSLSKEQLQQFNEIISIIQNVLERKD